MPDPEATDPLRDDVRSAWHRWIDMLVPLRPAREPEGAASSRRPAPSPELLDRFVDRYRARDVGGLVALMLDGAIAENVGNSVHVGMTPDGIPHFLGKVVHGHAEWPAVFMPDAARLERVDFDGEPILVLLATRRGREALEVVFRIEEHDGKIARFRAYGFCPETVRAVGEALGLRVRTGLYRAPTPAPGAEWPAP